MVTVGFTMDVVSVYKRAHESGHGVMSPATENPASIEWVHGYAGCAYLEDESGRILAHTLVWLTDQGERHDRVYAVSRRYANILRAYLSNYRIRPIRGCTWVMLPIPGEKLAQSGYVMDSFVWVHPTYPFACNRKFPGAICVGRGKGVRK